MLKNYLYTFSVFILACLLVVVPTYADYASDCSGTADLENPHPTQILCSVMRVFNAFILSAGAVFIIVMAYGGWKISLSLGDPKGLAGGKNAWTYAVIGLFVVLMFFSFFIILSGLLGLNNILNPTDWAERVYGALNAFLTASSITPQ